MALQAELVSLLDNSDEPLSKRLRIATDVFNTNELPAFNKESVLFNWFGKTCLKTDTNEIWDTLFECITSPRMKDISTNELKHNVLSSIVKAALRQLKREHDGDVKNNILKCGIAILNIDVFQQYFKHDLKQYCGLVSEILVNANDITTIREIIAINLSFNEKNFDKTEYTTHFLSSTLDALIKVLTIYQDDNLYKDALELINRAIFSINSNDFITFLTKAFEQTGNLQESNIIYDKLKTIYTYDKQSAKLGFKIIFSSSLSICSTEILRYKLFVLMIHTIGFKVKKSMNINVLKHDESFELEKSLEILADIFHTIYTKNILIKETINEITYSNFLKSLISSVIRIQTLPNISTLRILKYIIDIDPLIFENIIDEILVFVTLSKKDDNLQFIYAELMISIMKMYFKLHRVAKFYFVLLETIQKKICSNLKSPKPEIKFSGEDKNSSTSNINCVVKDVLPDNVLQYFQECITLQSSKEVTKIIRNCVYNLKQIADDIPSYADDQKVFYVQIVSEITCNVLGGVNTGSEYSLNKFIDDMNSLREELKKFGTALLTVEHNHLLMFSFLNICYTWGEVAILLTFYTSAENLNLKGEIENDKSVNNLTYLHNYLSAEQWSLVLQRIKNFGEQPCKHILQKLLIQKFRAMLIFESEVSEVIESSIVSNYATNLETSWDIILSERFIASTFVPKMESSQLITLAEFIIDHILKKNNFELLKQRTIIDSRDLMTSIFFVCLSKISDLFKRKRKHGDSTNVKPLCIKIFKCVDANLFIKSEEVHLEKITEYFSDTFSQIQDLLINEESFCTYMEILKYIPVTSLSDNVQVTLFLYLLSICYDLRNCKAQNIKCLEKCEEYLIALVENNLSSPNIFKYMKPDILVMIIMESVEKYKTLLSIIIGKGITQNDTIPLCKSVISLLEKNISDVRYLNTVFIVLHIFIDATLKNVSKENKAILQKYKEKIYKKLLKLTTMDDETISDNKIIMYTLLLDNYLDKDTENILTKLIPLLKHYIDYAVNNIHENNAEEFLHLFKLVLTRTPDIMISMDVPKDFNMSAWEASKALKNIDKYTHFNKMLFEIASEDDFTTILQELLDTNLIYMKSAEPDNIINQVKIWKILMNSTLSNKKNQITTNMIQILFSNLAALLINNNNNQDFNKEFVSLQINIIEKQKVQLSPTIIDVHFQTTQILIANQQEIKEFITAFETSFPILESLAKYRKELLIDRLPTFLLHFRLYLHHLCLKSDSNVNLNQTELTKITDCAFRIEKLTRNICMMKTDIVRITPNLIADFLKEFEKIALYPDVKYHLNNCLMELVALCDNHAVSYLLRVLSPASTELFKEIHNNYKKFYKFTGKV